MPPLTDLPLPSFVARIRRLSRTFRGSVAFSATFFVVWLGLQSVSLVFAADGPRLCTHESYVEEVAHPGELPLGDINAMFAWVLRNISNRVKVYPTENYYYFRFMQSGLWYGGNIRLDAVDRDAGNVHFAYFEESKEYRMEPQTLHKVFGAADGVTVEKIDRLLYRVAYMERSVLFELNDLSMVAPPPGAITPEEIFIGPVFDDSAIRFFLVFNNRLKIFNYVLDETVRVQEDFFEMRHADRILIGKRTGFAFYRDDNRDRKILIGVFEGNVRLNNYFDGPFDQLPDNFIEGDTLQKALIESDPSLAGKIDRFGHFADGAGRVSISPYTYYRTEAELLPFYMCAKDPKIPPENYYACFVFGWRGTPGISAYNR
jgi:hypothetical protein